MEELLARHKKEQRDLVAKITNLKKQASKKTRKSVNSQCVELQVDLDARHSQELAAFNNTGSETLQEVSPQQLLEAMKLDGPVDSSGADHDETETNIASPISQSQAQTGGKKRNRAKERLAKRQAHIDAIKAEAREEASNSVDYRAIEAESMLSLLESQGLQLYEIKPDGHCLFSSIQDQLQLRHGLSEVSVSTLRKQAAEHIRQNRDSFIPYILDHETMAVRDVNEYTKELEDTAMWGSDMEIAALAAVYECPIKVLMAGSAPITFNESAGQPQLILAYYKHSYGLGEHYNSCR